MNRMDMSQAVTELEEMFNQKGECDAGNSRMITVKYTEGTNIIKYIFFPQCDSHSLGFEQKHEDSPLISDTMLSMYIYGEGEMTKKTFEKFKKIYHLIGGV